MSVSSTVRKAGPFLGNGSASVFPFGFKVFTSADLSVIRLDTSGTLLTLALTTDYIVTLNPNQDSNPGGSITLVAGALATGYSLVVTTAIPELQNVVLQNLGAFFPDVINDALDRLTILIQQMQEQADRSIKFPSIDPVLTSTLPAVASRKGLLLGFDPTSGDAVAVAGAVNPSAGPFLGNLIGDVTSSGASSFSTLNGKSIGSVLYADQYASGSNTGGIAEAYAAGPSTGVTVKLGADFTISSAQTITTVVGKPLYLDGQGHKITFTHTSGVGLLLLKPDSTPRTSVVISNLRMVYGGSSASVTGLKIGSQAAAATDVILRDVEINNFNTSGAVALELDNVNEGHFYSVKLNGNTLALKLDKFTNNNQFFGTNIQGGVQAISMTDASGNNFIGGLIQSNSGVRTITQTSSTIAINGNTFEDVWMENNGDTTANSRVFYSFATGTAHNIAGFSSVGNTINAGTNGASGKVYEFAADSTSFAVSPILKGNSYGAYGANIITGTAVFPTSVEGESATFADAGINLSGAPGFHFWPQTGGHHYQMFAGDSVNSGNTNNWLMKDLTASTTPLLYTASTQAWLLPGAIQLGAADVGLSRGAAGQVNVGNGTAGDASGKIVAGSAQIGAAGVAVTKLAKYTATLSPVAVPANSVAVQFFTVTGISSGDVVVGVMKPTAQAGLSILSWYNNGTNSLGLTFFNNTAAPITPTASELYSIVVMQ